MSIVLKYVVFFKSEMPIFAIVNSEKATESFKNCPSMYIFLIDNRMYLGTGNAAPFSSIDSFHIDVAIGLYSVSSELS